MSIESDPGRSCFKTLGRIDALSENPVLLAPHLACSYHNDRYYAPRGTLMVHGCRTSLPNFQSESTKNTMDCDGMDGRLRWTRGGGDERH